MSLLLLILIIVALVALCGGGLGYSRYDYGAWAFGPFWLIVALLLVLWAAGILR